MRAESLHRYEELAGFITGANYRVDGGMAGTVN